MSKFHLVFLFILCFLTDSISVFGAQNQVPLNPATEQVQSQTQNHIFTSNAEPGTSADSETAAKSKFVVSNSVKKLCFAIACVTLLFMVLILILKKYTPGEAPQLPKEVFEILGKSPLAFRQQLYIMRCGKKLFIVSLSQNGLDRVGEIEDPVEVEHLTYLCHGGRVIPEANYKEWTAKNTQKAERGIE